MYADPDSRASYCDKHLLGTLPTEIADFAVFYERRKTLLRARIAELLQKQAEAK